MVPLVVVVMEAMETVLIGVIERPIPEQGQRAPQRGFLIDLH